MEMGPAIAAAGVALLIVAWVARPYIHRTRYTVREFPGFLSPQECDHLIQRSESVMKKSTVMHGGRTGSDHVDRDSYSGFLSQVGDPIIQRIKQRIAEISDTPLENQEKIQVTHYFENQRYDRHYDALSYGRIETDEAGDRNCTVIVYLNDEYEGGATYFPRIRRRVLPERGKAILFHNLTSDGRTHHRLSEHQGEVVRGGEKWICNQWIRQNRRFHPKPKKARKLRRSGRR